jgi:hypothetical protein
VAQVEGVDVVARSLRLDPGSLAHRAGGVGAGAPTFVEIAALAPRSGEGGCIVEVLGPNGGRLTIKVPEIAGLDIPGLASVVVGARR